MNDGHGERYIYEDWDVDEQWSWLGYDGEMDDEYNGMTVQDEYQLRRWYRKRGGKDSVLRAAEKDGVEALARRMLGEEPCERRLWVGREMWDGIWGAVREANGRGRDSCERWFVPKVEAIVKEHLESRFCSRVLTTRSNRQEAYAECQSRNIAVTHSSVITDVCKEVYGCIAFS